MFSEFLIVEAVQVASFFIYGNIITRWIPRPSVAGGFRLVVLDPILDALFLFGLPILVMHKVDLLGNYRIAVFVIAFLINIYATIPGRVGLNKFIAFVLMLLTDTAILFLYVRSFNQS